MMEIVPCSLKKVEIMYTKLKQDRNKLYLMVKMDV